MDEFALIARYFRDIGAEREEILLGVGDDAALIVPPPDCALAVTTDTLVEGIHFPRGIAPADLARRSLAVNLSDLAAMGAEPCFATLALTLSEAREDWLAEFGDALHSALAAAGVALVGGDTTRGDLSVTFQLNGFVTGQALRRDGAEVGDVVFVSGSLGDARAALDVILDGKSVPSESADFVRARYLRPCARNALGCALRGVANAAIDVSDGLVSDLSHIARASAVAIDLEWEALPLSTALARDWPRETALDYAASGGDDYELAITVPAASVAAVSAIARGLDLALTQIGVVGPGEGVRLLDAQGVDRAPRLQGYRHFTAA